jgi:hypothetical protein
MMETVSHDIEEESLEAKARWFQSLSIAERIDMLCMFTDLALNNDPSIAERRNDQPACGRVLVVSKAQD